MAQSIPPGYRRIHQKPRITALLAGFAISFVIGLLMAQVISFLYAVLGQGGGLECLRFPLTLFVIAISAVVSFYATRLINQRIARRS